MEVKTELYTSSFRLSKKFTYPHNGTEDACMVRLDIDHRGKTFSITPDNGLDKFEFRVGSHKSAMWKAISELIKEACEFAEKQLNPSEDPF